MDTGPRCAVRIDSSAIRFHLSHAEYGSRKVALVEPYGSAFLESDLWLLRLWARMSSGTSGSRLDVHFDPQLRDQLAGPEPYD